MCDTTESTLLLARSNKPSVVVLSQYLLGHTNHLIKLLFSLLLLCDTTESTRLLASSNKPSVDVLSVRSHNSFDKTVILSSPRVILQSLRGWAPGWVGGHLLQVSCKI